MAKVYQGAWIPLRLCLWTHPKVVAIARRLHGDGLIPSLSLTGYRALALGGLYRLWAIADEHTDSGILPGYDEAMIDDETGIQGFAAAVVAVDWLRIFAKEIRIVKFKTYMGRSAKSRYKANQRQALYRVKLSRSQRDKSVTTLHNITKQKRREEKREDQSVSTPTGDDQGAGISASDRYVAQPFFARFWKALPPRFREAKTKTRNRFVQAVKDGADPDRLIERIAEYYKSPQGKGKYATHPPNWLADGKYEDTAEAWQVRQTKGLRQ